jgi:hypothetical protein
MTHTDSDKELKASPLSAPRRKRLLPHRAEHLPPPPPRGITEQVRPRLQSRHSSCPYTHQRATGSPPNKSPSATHCACTPDSARTSNAASVVTKSSCAMAPPMPAPAPPRAPCIPPHTRVSPALVAFEEKHAARICAAEPVRERGAQSEAREEAACAVENGIRMSRSGCEKT